MTTYEVVCARCRRREKRQHMAGTLPPQTAFLCLRCIVAENCVCHSGSVCHPVACKTHHHEGCGLS